LNNKILVHAIAEELTFHIMFPY